MCGLSFVRADCGAGCTMVMRCAESTHSLHHLVPADQGTRAGGEPLKKAFAFADYGGGCTLLMHCAKSAYK